MIRKTLGGDRLGTGNKMGVNLRGFERSNFDIGYVFRTTMSVGTLVPFMVEPATPGDTFDINLDAYFMTHPTIGPLFGSMKVQLDVFSIPIRLYHSALHNNKFKIGMNMASVKLPKFTASVKDVTTTPPKDLNLAQINPSCILAYLGNMGWGVPQVGGNNRLVNALALLMYYDTYKNYYANKQEEIGAVIHATQATINKTITAMDIYLGDQTTLVGTVTEYPTETAVSLDEGYYFKITYVGAQPDINTIAVTLQSTSTITDTFQQIALAWDDTTPGTIWILVHPMYTPAAVTSYNYVDNQSSLTVEPQIATFPLSNIDEMREKILAKAPTAEFNIQADAPTLTPYVWPTGETTSLVSCSLFSQEGLAIKTYQSDIFNNWLSTDWLDGAGGINEITAIDTSAGSFQLNTFLISKKIFDMLNAVAVSGGSYNDWIDAVWGSERYRQAETPMYMGGLIKELVFQEVVSNSATNDEPLGTIAGRGRLSGDKHKGGYIHISVDEPSYIMGLVSITPRIAYSQGNRWFTYALNTLDDIHKPYMDEIGFQESINEDRAWWTTQYDGTDWIQTSAGKQPAWVHYMTNYDRVYGNFAIENNENFMVLTRQYDYETNGTGGYQIADLTTYIDPVKYNNIFAQTSLDAMNFWCNLAVDITKRSKMSAKLMPNL